MNAEDLKRLNAFVRQKTKPELARLCQEKNLPIRGTKHDLAVRLLGIQLRPVYEVKSTKPVQEPIIIHKSEYGYYIHKPTRLVFDKASRRVVGRENEQGKVVGLTRHDIQICRQFKFQYEIPEMLDNPPSPIYKPKPNETQSFSLSDDELLEDQEDEFL